MPSKLYCYVDETGQDTAGDMFVVVMVIAGQDRAEMEREAVRLERWSGRGKTKWHRSRLQQRRVYAAKLSEAHWLKNRVYYMHFTMGTQYFRKTARSIVRGVEKYLSVHHDDGARVVVLVDGLKEAEGKTMRPLLKSEHFSVTKLRGGRDESEPLLRLADSIAGLYRDAFEGDVTFASAIEALHVRDLLRKR